LILFHSILAAMLRGTRADVLNGLPDFLNSAIMYDALFSAKSLRFHGFDFLLENIYQLFLKISCAIKINPQPLSGQKQTTMYRHTSLSNSDKKQPGWLAPLGTFA
jgi:hypothetical protein